MQYIFVFVTSLLINLFIFNYVQAETKQGFAESNNAGYANGKEFCEKEVFPLSKTIKTCIPIANSTDIVIHVSHEEQKVNAHPGSIIYLYDARLIPSTAFSLSTDSTPPISGIEAKNKDGLICTVLSEKLICKPWV